MMPLVNCWEFKACGREPGGARVDEIGVCPAATATECNGLNDGTNGGRICWTVAGTFCGGQVHGCFAEKRMSCLGCDFFDLVKDEIGIGRFMLLQPGQMYQPHS